MKTLAELSEFYVTDKRPSEHNYVRYYDTYFSRARSSSLSLMEIGILEHPDKANRPFGAASLQMWADYFPNASIFGMDIVDLRHLERERIRIFVGDQSNPNNLNEVFISNNLKPNIIIDDGSHRIPHQQLTFGAIFKYLASGGFYVIEDVVQFDLHKSDGGLIATPARFHGDENAVPMTNTSVSRNQENLYSTTFSMLSRYCVTGSIESPYISAADKEYIEKNIDFCNIHRSSIFNLHIAFIRKK